MSSKRDPSKETSNALFINSDTILQIRPHHLLCTRSYRGRGYSPAFTEHMNQIVKLLYCRKPGQMLTVQLTCSTDSICSCCPNKIKEGICKGNEKVCGYDQAVLEAFHLTEGLYDFDSLEASIEKILAEDLVTKICSDCSWYNSCHCSEEVIRGFSSARSIFITL